MTIFFTACQKDDFANAQFSDLDLETQIRRAGDTLTDAEINWLDTFRLNIKNTTLNRSYHVDDVVYGMEAFFNLIPGHGVKQINDVRSVTLSETYTISNNEMSRLEIKQLFLDVHSSIKTYYDTTSLSNKSYLFSDVRIDTLMSNSVDLVVKSVVADAVSVSNPAAYDFSDCEGSFDDEDCFLSGPYINPVFLGDGDCDGNQEGETGAQHQIEMNINEVIPSVIYNKFGLSGYIVFEDIRCIYIMHNDLAAFDHGITECENLLDFHDSGGPSEFEYDQEKLNCAQCIIEAYIEEYTAQESALSSLSITGDWVNFNVYWELEICYGEPVFVPIQTPSSFPLSNDMLNTSFTSKF